MNNILVITLALGLQFALSSIAIAQPAADFSDLENRYIDSEALSLSFHISASGAVQADIEGSLQKTSAGIIYLAASGSFAGQDIDLIVKQNNSELTYGDSNKPKIVEASSNLWEALVIGFTRMGILHNIAQLSAGDLPDHAMGAVRQWVKINNVQRDAQAYTFDIIVTDVPSGSASLVMDETESPNLREQIVAFPGGEMTVVEAYSNISISE